MPDPKKPSTVDQIVDLLKGLMVGVPAVGGVLAGTALQQRISTRSIAGLFAGLLAISAALLVL